MKTWTDYDDSRALEIYAGLWAPLKGEKAAAFFRGVKQFSPSVVVSALEKLGVEWSGWGHPKPADVVGACQVECKRRAQSSPRDRGSCPWCRGAGCLPATVYTLSAENLGQVPSTFRRQTAGGNWLVMPEFTREEGFEQYPFERRPVLLACGHCPRSQGTVSAQEWARKHGEAFLEFRVGFEELDLEEYRRMASAEEPEPVAVATDEEARAYAQEIRRRLRGMETA